MTTHNQDTSEALARLTGRLLARTILMPVGLVMRIAFNRYLKKNAEHFTELDRATLLNISKNAHNDGTRAAHEFIQWLDHFETRKNRA
ncbi:hypothetical protein VVR12_01670 [Rothia sp. LK2588]|uniref:hypothetical protein n=1 Tax=Rothia sp. LK2588 TaxID=3114369 RepID=UPI0034CE8209